MFKQNNVLWERDGLVCNCYHYYCYQKDVCMLIYRLNLEWTIIAYSKICVLCKNGVTLLQNSVFRVHRMVEKLVPSVLYYICFILDVLIIIILKHEKTIFSHSGLFLCIYNHLHCFASMTCGLELLLCQFHNYVLMYLPILKLSTHTACHFIVHTLNTKLKHTPTCTKVKVSSKLSYQGIIGSLVAKVSSVT